MTNARNAFVRIEHSLAPDLERSEGRNDSEGVRGVNAIWALVAAAAGKGGGVVGQD